MSCAGCEFGVGFYPVGLPFFWAMAGFEADGNPNGSCTGEPPNCQPGACYATGWATVISNVVQKPIRVHYRTYSGDSWTDYVLDSFGQAMAFHVPGVQIDCGGEHVAAEVWDDSSDPSVLLGSVKLTCGACHG